jgi:methylated-DNA-protein-cysteine methyltransferase-like protein
MLLMSNEMGLYQRIYWVVSMIPAGRVATYGQIARILGRCSSRNVGYAMHSVPADSGVPWHRVINSRGRISVRSDGGGCRAQKQMLMAEGVVFNHDKVDLDIYGWEGPGPEVNVP